MAWTNLKHGVIDEGPAIQTGPNVSPDDDWSDWVCIYPSYIDAKKSVREGRRIASSISVDGPTVDEIGVACSQLNLLFVIEYQKSYPRDWLIPGRVRVRTSSTASISSTSVKAPDAQRLYSKIELLRIIAALVGEEREKAALAKKPTKPALAAGKAAAARPGVSPTTVLVPKRKKGKSKKK